MYIFRWLKNRHSQLYSEWMTICDEAPEEYYAHSNYISLEIWLEVHHYSVWFDYQHYLMD